MSFIAEQKKELFILLVGKVLQVSIALISIKLITTYLSTEEVGKYYLLIALISLFSFTLMNPLGQYFSRHILFWSNHGNLKNATNVLIVLRVLGTIIAIFFSAFIYTWLDYEQYYNLGEFLLFIFLSLIAGIQLVFISSVNLLGNRLFFVKYLITTLLLGLLISTLIVFFIDRSGMGWLYGILLSQITVLFFTYRYLTRKQSFDFRKVRSKLNKGYIRSVVIFVIPVALTLFLQWGQIQSYRFIVEYKYTLEVLGFIAVGLAIVSAIFSAIESLMTQYYNPIFLKRITGASMQERTKAWNYVANQMIPFYILLAFFVIFLAPYLVRVLSSEKFVEAYVFVMIGVGIEFFRVLTNIVYMVSQSELNTQKTIFPYFIGFITSLFILLWSDLEGYLWGIPLILAISYMVVFMIMFFSMRKLLKIKINLKVIFFSILVSIPFSLTTFIEKNIGMIESLFALLVFSLYLLIAGYFIYKRINKEVS